ncbi:hypothetical protein EVAR_37792_1 [Eumeta japonica]|uniref:Uncharacterized protein n=1 Tax=Eumeta variegata TaxID=151549 RepID=A0A4C1W6A0_EUMVA|nr:hypothetical protein EVAR_37792_1 [Eumeta japonica]
MLTTAKAIFDTSSGGRARSQLTSTRAGLVYNSRGPPSSSSANETPSVLVRRRSPLEILIDTSALWLTAVGAEGILGRRPFALRRPLRSRCGVRLDVTARVIVRLRRLVGPIACREVGDFSYGEALELKLRPVGFVEGFD